MIFMTKSLNRVGSWDVRPDLLGGGPVVAAGVAREGGGEGPGGGSRTKGGSEMGTNAGPGTGTGEGSGVDPSS